LAKAKEDKQIIQIFNYLHGLPSSAPALPSRTTPVDQGGDTKQIIQNPNILPKCHPCFPQGKIEDFDFTHQSNGCADGAPPHGGGTAHSPPPGGHVCFSPSNIDTSNDMVLGSKITTPCFTDHSHVARAKKTSKFDSAGLAEARYHIGNMGVDVVNSADHQQLWLSILPLGSPRGYSPVLQPHANFCCSPG
jgi:hypothetical protein